MKLDKRSDFSEWYNTVIREAEIIDDRYNVKGFVVHRPWGMRIIKAIYKIYEEALEKRGHEPVLFPTVIPEENLRREEEHVEYFKAEVFWVTHGADKLLPRKLALRPTSETAFYYMYSYWIRSYRDLPFKAYQSCSVFRYETKATKPLLRGREFLWIEAHDAFPTPEDAYKQVKEDMEIAREVIYGRLAIPFIFFQRPQWDKFRGAEYTFAADCLMPDGRFNQVASTHYLGQRFAKAFDIKFLDKDGVWKYPYQTCYGPGIWRILAALISIHGDDHGLILPFDIAPIQIVIIPIPSRDVEYDNLISYCRIVEDQLRSRGYRVKLDSDPEVTPGAKFYFWEFRGVPLRIEVGLKEMMNRSVTVCRRDTFERVEADLEKLQSTIEDLARRILENLRSRAERELESRIVEASSIEEVGEAVSKGMIARAPFCSIDYDGEPCGEKLKEMYSAEVRGVRIDLEEEPPEKATCIVCGRPAKHYVYIGKSY